jgi:CRP-like cAMP-binding protein
MAIKPEQLQNIAYFKDLNVQSRVMLRLAQATIEEKFVEHQLLFLEGEECKGLYHVVDGQIRVYKTASGGREQILRLIGPGATFNEVPVLDGGLTAANAQALKAGILWLVPTAAILEALDEEPALARTFIRSLAARMRYLTDVIGEISLKQVTARVARILMSQVENDPILSVGLSNEITGQLNQQQMAALTGTVRDMVGRALRTMEKAGALEVRRGYVTIKDKVSLQKFL